MSRKSERRRQPARNSAEYEEWIQSRPKSFFDDLAEQEAGTLPMDAEVVQAFVDEELETLRGLAESNKGEVADLEPSDDQS